MDRWSEERCNVRPVAYNNSSWQQIRSKCKFIYSITCNAYLEFGFTTNKCIF